MEQRLERMTKIIQGGTNTIKNNIKKALVEQQTGIVLTISLRIIPESVNDNLVMVIM